MDFKKYIRQIIKEEISKLNFSNVYYHVSRIENRDSISEHGLDYNKGISPWESPEDPIDYPKGNYVWTDLKKAKKYAYGLSGGFDIWQVNIDSNKLKDDPITDGGFYITDIIEKENLILITTVEEI